MSAALSYSSGESETPLLGDTIGANFDATVARFSGREALVDRTTGRRWTYAELAADVDALALGLLELGIGKADRVGIWAPNCPEWTLTQYATAKIGAILVNINPAYRTRELEFVLNQSGTRLLIAAERLKTSDYAAMIAEVRPRCEGLSHVVIIGGPDWQSLIQRGRQLDRSALESIELDTDDPINIQYTSGTTGFPKGATLSHHNILNNGFFVGELCMYTEADRICIPCPSIIASAWSWVISPRPVTARAWSSRPPASTRSPPSRPCRPNAVPRCTAFRRCSSPSCPRPASPATTCPACAPASWRARRARSR